MCLVSGVRSTPYEKRGSFNDSKKDACAVSILLNVSISASLLFDCQGMDLHPSIGEPISTMDFTFGVTLQIRPGLNYDVHVVNFMILTYFTSLHAAE